MGQVYRARDTRLDRIVAIKVLAQSIGGTPEMLQRFEREARAISTLNHPNICTLHDLGTENGAPYLVMEYVEGQTLAERLTRGPLPLEDAWRVAIQIGEALDLSSTWLPSKWKARSPIPVRTEERVSLFRPAGPLARWDASRVQHEHRRFPGGVVPALAGFNRKQATAGNRRRVLSVLVTRRALRSVLCAREVAEDGSDGR